MTETQRTIKIPLTDNRNITIKFCKSDDNLWKCVMTDEFITDIVTFFNNGYYKLDFKKQIILNTK